MPHLTLEYSNNLSDFSPQPVLEALNQALLLSGEFAEIDIKSRAIAFEHFQIGTEKQRRGFIHVTLAIFSGRSTKKKQSISQKLLHALQQAAKLPADIEVQLCAEIIEIDRAAYSKTSSATKD
ncbi:5-carboxymethyl-2-hydroxymuconate Delta-isomerase [Neisseriaceae bacterium TC5R-5]|nr:5-carboxymethyl-2-hydroxymuconate Delta-isomerase [Neisseriaceae bacterium TC5R-5]